MGVGVRVSGLPLGFHKVRLTYISGPNPLQPNTFDISTPIHSPQGALFSQQNTLPIGSCSLADARGITETKEDLFVGIARGLTSNVDTTSTAFIPAAEMSLTVPSKGSWFRIYFTTIVQFNVTMEYAIYINGIQTRTIAQRTGPVASAPGEVTLETIEYLPSGTHKVDVYWRTTSGTGRLYATFRILTVEELEDRD